MPPPGPARGRFIVLEGGEGAGKSTQARLLAEALCARGLPVLRTREPGGAPGSEFLREALLSGAHDWSPEAETMLHVAARIQHVARTIRPAIESGSWAVCDRFHDSTLAYQGHGLGVDRGLIEGLRAHVGLTPDLTLVLDVPRDVARARLRERGLADDRYERLDEDFHARVNAAFRVLADAPGHVLVDASGDVGAVHRAILTAVERLMPVPNMAPLDPTPLGEIHTS